MEQSNLKEEIKKAKQYVKNLSDRELTDSEYLLLSKNLKFVPTPDTPRMRDLLRDFDDMASRMRTRMWMFENKTKPKNEPFTCKRERPDRLSENGALESYITATKIELAN